MESLFVNMIRICSGPNQIELRSSEISNAKILRFVIFSGSSAVGKDSIHEIARSRVKRTVEIQHPRTRLRDLITCPYQCRKMELALQFIPIPQAPLQFVAQLVAGLFQCQQNTATAVRLLRDQTDDQ